MILTNDGLDNLGKSSYRKSCSNASHYTPRRLSSDSKWGIFWLEEGGKICHQEEVWWWGKPLYGLFITSFMLQTGCLVPPTLHPSGLKMKGKFIESSLLFLSPFHLSVQFSRSVMSDSLRPHELQHARPPCPSPTPGVHPNSCPLSWWCHPTISSSVVPFSSCLQSLPASESFPMSQLFAWGGQNIGVSALSSFLLKNTQDWSPLEWTGWISLQSKGLSRIVFK